jgi:hypothetical protein
MEFALIPVLRDSPKLARKVGAGTQSVNLSRRHAHAVSLQSAGLCRRDNDGGSWVLHATNAIRAEGTFLEKYWAWRVWDPSSPTWKSCEEAVNGGAPSTGALEKRYFFIDQFRYLPPFGLSTVASARTPEHLEGILGQGHPVVLSVFLLKEPFDRAWRNGGYVNPPRDPQASTSAIHYVLLVGFDRRKKRFIFANSWGTRFGTAGFGFLAYDYVHRYAVDGLYIERMRVRDPD